jgi:hypothetical protein
MKSFQMVRHFLAYSMVYEQYMKISQFECVSSGGKDESDERKLLKLRFFFDCSTPFSSDKKICLLMDNAEESLERLDTFIDSLKIEVRFVGSGSGSFWSV